MNVLETTQMVPLTELDDGTIVITGTPIALEIVVARHNAGDTPAKSNGGFHRSIWPTSTLSSLIT